MVTLVQVFLQLLWDGFSFNLHQLNGKYATTTKQILNSNYFYYKIGITGTKFLFGLHQLKGRYETYSNFDDNYVIVFSTVRNFFRVIYQRYFSIGTRVVIICLNLEQ
jgi:hypothetical protein